MSDSQKPFIRRFPRLDAEGERAMVEEWKNRIWETTFSNAQARVNRGMFLLKIKATKSYGSYGKFKKWFDEQGFEFSFRSAEIYMNQATAFYLAHNTNKSSYLKRRDEVHKETAKQQKKLDAMQFQFTLRNLSGDERKRLRALRNNKTERDLAEKAVKDALGPWMRGERNADRTA